MPPAQKPVPKSARGARAVERAAPLFAEATAPQLCTPEDVSALCASVASGSAKLAQQAALLLGHLRAAQFASEDTREHGLYVRAQQALAVWEAEAAMLATTANRVSLAQLQLRGALADLEQQLAALDDADPGQTP